MSGRYVGARVPRLEDRRLLTGSARFADDIDLAGQLTMRIVRAAVAHAEIASVDVHAARAHPRVRLVLTGQDVAHLGTVPLEEIGYHEQFPDLEAYGHPLLAHDRVRYVGQPVVAVIADDPYAAEDAAELVTVDYRELDVVLDPRIALDPDTPRLHEPLPNEAARFDREYGDVDGAFEAAAHVVRTSVSIGRHTGVPMETRACIADYDPGRDHLTIWGPVHTHDNRRLIARQLGLPETSIRMRHADIGGSFGTRGGVFPEHVLVPYAARILRQPVKWVEDRAEHLVAIGHAREQQYEIEGAFDQDGRLLAIRTEIWHNKGAYLRQASPLVSDITVGIVCGPYRVPAYRGTIHVALTNKTPLSAYRAPGRFECTFARERLLDLAAAEIGIDPVEIRRRNLLAPADLPWQPGITMVGEKFVLDSGDFTGHFDTALRACGYDAWIEEAATLRAKGRRVGTGIAVLLDKAGLGLYETASVEVTPTGRVRILTGGSSNGQGIETVLAQICADELTLRPDDCEVLHGDTDLVPDGVGSWSSRSTVIAGSAVQNAARETVTKARRLAAELLEAAETDLVLADGALSVTGSPERRITLAEIAATRNGWTARLAGDEPGLGARGVHLEHHMNYPYGITAVQVEIDPDTCGIQLRRFFTSCEAGRVINPTTTEGQVAGAAAQGIGGALFEELAYDDLGQPIATSFVDYLVPTACEIPDIQLLITEDAPTPDNPLGAKGIGEVGLIAVGAAIASAVDDSVDRSSFVTTLPLSPARMHKVLKGDPLAISP